MTLSELDKIVHRLRCDKPLSSGDIDAIEDAARRSIAPWASIETAPKDRHILLYGEQEPHEMVRMTGPIILCGYWDACDEEWCSIGSAWTGPFYNVTHWCELPPPPSMASEHIAPPPPTPSNWHEVENTPLPIEPLPTSDVADILADNHAGNSALSAENTTHIHRNESGQKIGQSSDVAGLCARLRGAVMQDFGLSALGEEAAAMLERQATDMFYRDTKIDAQEAKIQAQAREIERLKENEHQIGNNQ